MKISVVMPCRNEAATVGLCIEKAKQSLQSLGMDGEIIVVDNNSTDASGNVARNAGAKVILQNVEGYGASCIAGLDIWLWKVTLSAPVKSESAMTSWICMDCS